MSDLTTKAHLRAGAQAGRSYTDSVIGTLAGTVADAIEEAREAKTTTYNVPLTKWRKSDDRYYCDISIPDMTPQTIVNVSVPDESVEVAAACGLSWMCESRDGALRLHADSAPSKTFSVQVGMVTPAE